MSFLFGVGFCFSIMVFGYILSDYMHPTPTTPYTTDALRALADSVNESKFTNGLTKSVKNINKNILLAAMSGNKYITVDLPSDVSDRLFLDDSLRDSVVEYVRKQIIHKGEFSVKVDRYGFSTYTLNISWY